MIEYYNTFVPAFILFNKYILCLLFTDLIATMTLIVFQLMLTGKFVWYMSNIIKHSISCSHMVILLAAARNTDNSGDKIGALDQRFRGGLELNDNSFKTPPRPSKLKTQSTATILIEVH